jgi:hypothetical protein
VKVHSSRWILAALGSTALCLATIAAQDKVDATGDLKASEDGKAYVHGPSRSQFVLPPNWEVVPGKPIGKSSFLGVRQGAKNPGDPTIDVLLSWSPLTVELKDVIDAVERETIVPNTDGKEKRKTFGIEHDLMQMLYGKEKVGKPDAVTVNERPGFKVVVDNGPTLDGKEAGVVYIFETGPDEKNRWKVKLRGTMSKLHKSEGLKTVDEIVKNLKW